MKKILGIYYGRTPDASGFLYDTRQFRECLHDIRDSLKHNGIKTVLLTTPDSYIGGGLFSSYWDFSDEEKGKFIKIEKNISPDLIFDKGHLDFDDGFLKYFNEHNFARLGRNKYTQSIIAEKYLPYTRLVSHEKDTKNIIESFKTTKIIKKELDKNGGQGIELFDKENKIEIEKYPVILQEFIETSGGIEGMIKGRHDIRLYILSGEVTMASIRCPQAGGFLSNTHQGGTITFYGVDQINKSLLDFAGPLIDIFNKRGGKYYSLDFMRGENKWFFVEMNDRPGIPALYQDTHGEIKYFFGQLSNLICKEISK